jgi:hypothetical protein
MAALPFGGAMNGFLRRLPRSFPVGLARAAPEESSLENRPADLPVVETRTPLQVSQTT